MMGTKPTWANSTFVRTSLPMFGFVVHLLVWPQPTGRQQAAHQGEQAAAQQHSKQASTQDHHSDPRSCRLSMGMPLAFCPFPCMGACVAGSAHCQTLHACTACCKHSVILSCCTACWPPHILADLPMFLLQPRGCHQSGARGYQKVDEYDPMERMKRLATGPAVSSLQEELTTMQHEVDINNFTYKPVPRTDEEEE
ncbi:hypothetical protein COO60DRAFT_657541 [Scenedesmus sp. NREL 46B-D3]|nr:hypothetical protein COO60DRAFT_657541 [Scenedesmus sp. NREL 46B-D3]